MTTPGELIGTLVYVLILGMIFGLIISGIAYEKCKFPKETTVLLYIDGRDEPIVFNDALRFRSFKGQYEVTSKSDRFLVDHDLISSISINPKGDDKLWSR